MATTPTPPPGSGGTGAPGSTVTLTIAVDAKTGQITIQNVTAGLKGMASAAGAAGAAAGGAGGAAASSAGGWLKLYAQTELVARGFNMMKGVMHDTIVETALVAARTEVLNTTLAVTAKNMNYTVGAAQAQVEAIRRMNITHQDSINLTLQFMRAQLDLAKATNLARAAQDLAVVTGENSSQTASTLIEAIQNQNVLMLRQYGIVTNQNMIYERYANALNRSADSLSSVERRAAFLNYTLLEANKISGAYIAAMEDAGKKMTSLDRVFQDAREHIGERFLPIMNKVVDALYALGETVSKIPGWMIDLVGAMATAVTTAAALTVGIMALAKAWDFVATAAKAAMVAQGAAAGSSAVGTLVSLIKVHPYVAAIVGLLAIGAGIYTTWGARAEAHYKLTVNAAQGLLGMVQSGENLKKQYQDMVDLQTKLGDVSANNAQLTDRELHSYKLLNEEQNRRLVTLEKSQELQARQNALLNAARVYSADLTRIERDAATGKERQVVDMQRLAAVQETYRKQLDEQIRAMEVIAEERRKDYQASVSQIQRWQQTLEQFRKMGEIPGAFGKGAEPNIIEQLQKAVEKSAELKKALDQVNQELETIRSTANGLQLIPVAMEQTVQTLQTGFQTWQTIVQLARSGGKATSEELLLAQNTVQAARGAFQDISKAVDAALATKQRDKSVTAEQQALYKQLGDNIKKAYGDQLAGAEAQISKTKDLGSQITAMFRAYRAGTDAAGKDLQNLGVDLGSINNTMLAMLQFELQLRQAARDRASEQVQASVQELEIRQRVLGAQTQTYGVRKQQIELEAEITAKQNQDLMRQYALLGGNAKQYAVLLEQARVRIQQLQQEQLEREKRQALEQLEIQREQARQAAASTTLAERESLLKRQYELEAQSIRETYSDEADLTKALKALWGRYFAELFGMQQQSREQIRNLQLETIRLQQSAVESGKGPAGFQEEQIKAIADLDKRRVDMEVNNYKLSKDYLDKLKEDRQSAEAYLEAYRKNLEAQHVAYVKGLWMDYYDAVKRRQQEREAILDRAYRVERGFTQIDLDLREQERALIAQLDQMLREGILKSEKERSDIEERLLGQLRREAELRRIASESDAARRAQGLNQVMGPEMVAKALKMQAEAAKEARDNYAKVLDEYEKGKATLQELVDAADAVQKTMLSLPDIFQAWANGLPVDKVDVFKASVSTMADAVGQAYSALLQGQNVGAAFRSAIGKMLQASAVQSMVSSVQELAAGIAALTPWGAAIYGPAGIHFKAAAMFAAAAAATGAAGAAIGGGGGGGGSAGEAGANLGRPQPVSTKTSMEEGIIRLNDNLVVASRVIQYAGTQYSNLGAQLYQFTKEVNTLASSTSESVRQMADKLANDLAKVAQGGFQPAGLQALFNELNAWLATNTQTAQQQLGILQTVSGQLLETQQAAQQSSAQASNLPQMISDKLSESLHSVQRAQDDNSQVMIELARRQLQELVKANEKDMTIQVDASTYLDGGTMGTLMEQSYVKNTSTYKRQVAGAVLSATGQNVNRQQMGRLLGNGGI